MPYVCVWASNKKGVHREKGLQGRVVVGLVEAHVMMCIAGDFNGHVGSAETGEDESIGFGWGNRN